MPNWDRDDGLPPPDGRFEPVCSGCDRRPYECCCYGGPTDAQYDYGSEPSRAAVTTGRYDRVPLEAEVVCEHSTSTFLRLRPAHSLFAPRFEVSTSQLLPDSEVTSKGDEGIVRYWMYRFRIENG